MSTTFNIAAVLAHCTCHVQVYVHVFLRDDSVHSIPPSHSFSLWEQEPKLSFKSLNFIQTILHWWWKSVKTDAVEDQNIYRLWYLKGFNEYWDNGYLQVKPHYRIWSLFLGDSLRIIHLEAPCFVPLMHYFVYIIQLSDLSLSVVNWTYIYIYIQIRQSFLLFISSA